MNPAVLSIAGFDPCGGAGVLADVKVFEYLGLRGMAVVCAQTVQNDTEFEKMMPCEELAFEQMEILSRKFDFYAIKIGLVPNFEFLLEALKRIEEYWPLAKVVWDPIFSASAGYDFHKELSSEKLLNILERIEIVTPNLNEIIPIQQVFKPKISVASLSEGVDIYLKAGHASGEILIDELWSYGEKTLELPYPKIKNGEKHGSGCVLSALIAGHLAKRLSIEIACDKSRRLMQAYLASSDDLLGSWFSK
jgi:hydroxymethylpyrimidine/phosphomethylpyrimidine kinase